MGLVSGLRSVAVLFALTPFAALGQQIALGSALGEYTCSLRVTDPLAARQIQRDALNSGTSGFTTQYAIGSGGPASVFATSPISNTGGGSPNEGTGSRHDVLSSSFLGGVSGSVLGRRSTSTNRC